MVVNICICLHLFAHSWENRWYGHHLTAFFEGMSLGMLRRVVWHYLVLFIPVIKSQKMQKKCRKIMWPRTYRNCKAKQSQTWDIFKILFHMLCVRNLKSLQKILKNAENLCDHGHATIMIPNWAKLWNKLLSVFWWPPAKPQPNIIESGVSGHDQCSWVTFRKLGPLLVEVMNGCWKVLMQWWVVAEVTSGCSQGQHNQLCLHAKCGLWAVAVQGVTDDLVYQKSHLSIEEKCLFQ